MTTPLRAGCSTRQPVVVTAGVDAVRRRAARPGRRGAPRSTGGRRRRATEADLAPCSADPRRATANASAVERMLAAGAQLVDVRPAREVLGLRDRHVPARRAAARPGTAPPARCAAR